jgi:hypothetical protein
MAGYQHGAISERQWKGETQKLGDWLAPIIAFFAIVAVLLALISPLFESVR